MVSKYTCVISREMEDVKDKHQWKADVCQYVQEAFTLHEDDYAADCQSIYDKLESSYGSGRWIVFLFEPGGDTTVWYESGYCCTVKCTNTTTQHDRYIGLKCFPNSGCLTRSLIADPLAPASPAIKLVEKGNVDEGVIFECFEKLQEAGNEEKVTALQDALLTRGEKLGCYWGVCKCQKGAIICRYVQDKFIIFQYKSSLYCCFQQA